MGIIKDLDIAFIVCLLTILWFERWRDDRILYP
jgi:hypothetical protein